MAKSRVRTTLCCCCNDAGKCRNCICAKREILAGLKGVVTHESLVYRHTQHEHNQRLEELLKRMDVAGLTLNQPKCEFSLAIKFLGQLTERSVLPDPDIAKATTHKHHRTSKFSPQLADKIFSVHGMWVKGKHLWYQEGIDHLPCLSSIQTRVRKYVSAGALA